MSRSRTKKRSIRRLLRNVMSDVSQSSSSWIVTRSIPFETVDSWATDSILPTRMPCVTMPGRVYQQREDSAVHSGTATRVHHRSGYKDVPTDSEQSLMSTRAQQTMSITVETDQSLFQSYSTGEDHDATCVSLMMQGSQRSYKFALWTSRDREDCHSSHSSNTERTRKAQDADN